MPRAHGLALVLAVAQVACASTPVRCPYVPESGLPCPICRTHDELEVAGEEMSVPTLRRPPRLDRVPHWTGRSLPERPPAPSLYVRCRPCDCSPDGRIVPWDDWNEINRRAYERLRTASAPYPVAIVPGFHGGGHIMRYRLDIGLRLLRHDWVAALILSGGHRRGAASEARRMLDAVHEMAAEEGIDVTDRLFVEPCACRTTTNLRNGLRMMAAMGLERGIFVTEAKVSGQAQVLATDLDGLVARDLRCAVGRVSHLLGTPSLQRLPGSDNGCRPGLGFRHNPILFALPRREPVLFWVSPFTTLGAFRRSALDCGAGGPRIAECEPDDQDPWSDTCLPPLGDPDRRCTR